MLWISYSFYNMQIFYFINWIIARETIQVGKLFKWGNYQCKFIFSLMGRWRYLWKILFPQTAYWDILQLNRWKKCKTIENYKMSKISIYKLPFPICLPSLWNQTFCIFEWFWSNTNRKSFCILHRTVVCTKRLRLFSWHMNREYVM